MARFSVCGGDDGEGPSNNHQSRKRQRLPSIDEDEEDAENSDAGSSGEEEEEETQNQGRRNESEERGSTSDESDREMVNEDKRFGKLVNGQSSSSCKDSSISVTLLDPDVLDCPICCEALKIPIFQCDNGHLACSSCCTKVRNRCPSCTLPIGYIRCRGMEKVLETSRVSCANAKYGCRETTTYVTRFSHEETCVFSPCSCPILKCNFTGYYKDLNNHVRAEHKDAVIPFVWNNRLKITLDLNEKPTILQEANDGEVIVVQSFWASHAVTVIVSCIAPLARRVCNLSCSLVNINADNFLKQEFVVKNRRKVMNEPPECGFLLIPSYLYQTLNVQICIWRGALLSSTLSC
ncbi:E3 ubiquitin-protein ligase SINA-like 10 [Cardamine amara subsp. amara]|uniref:RING-type E3 ubiquitin transferase n=1 Tax=Cardamine amara subsp. amara TaxID=228776 RepID=A0ABD1AJQ2_CARAN